jgi:hypothetical protein
MADGRMLWLGIAGALLGQACSAPPAAKAPDAPSPASKAAASATASPVAPPPGAAPMEAKEPSPSAGVLFHCGTTAPSRARLEASFKTDWLLYDVDGGDAGGDTLLDDDVTVRIESTPATPLPSATLTVAVLTTREVRAPDVKPFARSGYNEGIGRHWFEMSKPFTLEKQADGWCFADRKPCPAKDAQERDFTRALGQSVELLSPLSEFSTVLDGKPSDGKRELRLPPLLLQRLGLARSQPITATQVNVGFPARFEAHLHAEKTDLIAAETPGGRAPRTHAKDVTLHAELDEHCRLVHYQIEQDARTTIAPGTRSASRFVHTRKYRVSF